jgi:hypothetical protein
MVRTSFEGLAAAREEQKMCAIFEDIEFIVMPLTDRALYSLEK